MTVEPFAPNVVLEQRQPQPTISIRETVAIAALGEAQDAMLQALSGYIAQHGVQPAGPPFVRYHTFRETETDLELGVPTGEPAAGEGRVAAGVLPTGPAISTWHLGAHDRLGEAYERLHLWLKEHGREPNGAGWEIYVWIEPSHYNGTDTWPSPADWRTQLIQPITEPR